MMRILLTILFIVFTISLQAQIQLSTMQGSYHPTYIPSTIDSLFYWFKADEGVLDSLGGPIGNNEGVETWTDYSGNGHDVFQTTDTDRPVWKATGGPGNKPCLQFDGSDDFLASAAHLWESDDITVIVVCKFANATRNAQESLVRKGNSSDNKRQFYFYGQNTANSYRIEFNANKDGGSTNFNTYYGSSKSTAYKALIHISNGAGAYSLYVDGSSVTYTNVSGGTADHTILDDSTYGFVLGALNVTVTPANFLQGAVSEIIVYSRAITADERVGIEEYLQAKYGL